MIYFDNAATTYPKPEEVYKAVDNANRNLAFNSGRGSYKKAKEVTKYIDETREILGNELKVQAKNVIFKSSATESLNAIIEGIDWNYEDTVYITPFEHNSIVRPLEDIRKKFNIKIKIIPFDEKTWELKTQELENMYVLEKPKAVFVSTKSNVTGYKLPYKQICEISKKYNCVITLDASQSFMIDKNINDADADFIVFAGHKSLYATFGIAGFIKKTSYPLKPTKFGGTGSDTMNNNMPEELPTKYEAGSPNIVAIIGLNTSLKWIKDKQIEEKEKELTQYFIKKVKDIPKVKVHVPKDEEKCLGIVSISIDEYLSEDVGQILDEEYDICVRTGYHCAPYIHDFISSRESAGTVRISFNYFNTTEEIDKLIEALKTF